MSGLQTYTVWFTEETTYRIPVQASSPFEAAKLLKRQWDDEGNENLEPESSEAKDFAVYDHNRQVTNIDDVDLDDSGNEEGER